MRRLAVTLAAAGAVLAAATVPAGAITAPRGVRVETFASGMGQPTNIAFDAQGRVWTTSGGNVTASTDGVWFTPRRGARPVHVIKGLFTALGLTWFRNELYVSYIVPYSDSVNRHTGVITAYSGFDGRRFARSRTVLSGIPIGEHTMDTVVPGPDGRLYVGVGSVFDHSSSPNRVSGSVISFAPAGGRYRLEAYGLRNPYGLAFIPGTRQLLVSDNGRDDLGLVTPPDELNIVDTSLPARFLGFPGCWGQGGAPCRGVQPPAARFAPHASADGMAVATSFGTYGLSAFVAQNGSSFPQNPTGSNVVRVALTRSGSSYRARIVPFASGFTKYDPLGAAMGPDGALYVTLFRSSRVVRFVPPAGG